jgi:hypothetical protein
MMFTGSTTGRIATCVCGLPITEWTFGTKTPRWTHDAIHERTDLCPGYRVATPVEGSIKVVGP